MGGGLMRHRLTLIILPAMLAASSSPVAAAAVVATAKAVAIKPLSIVKLGDLDFGAMISGTTTGTVVIDPTTDARTTTGGTSSFGGAPKAAQFITYGTQGSILQVTRGALPVLTRAGGGATMAVSQLTLNGPVTRVVNPAGIIDLRVGGTLNVSPNQLDGVYTATFDITVSYF